MDRNPAKYEQQKSMSREWKKANPERHAELARAYRARNRHKTEAQNKLNYAIRKGLIFRSPCQVCATTLKVHAHHHDYSKPLDVEWLCFECHRKAHPVGAEEKIVKFAGAKKASLPGEENRNASLTNKQAEEIRKMLGLKISQAKIGAIYGVSQVAVSRIKLNKTYSGAVAV